MRLHVLFPCIGIRSTLSLRLRARLHLPMEKGCMVSNFSVVLTSCLEKITRQMAQNDNVLRTKILKEINEEFHQGDKLNAALDSEVLYELARCFDEEDVTIRELASRAVIKVAGTEKGRYILIEDELIPRVKELFDDEVVQIRANGYLTMINISEFTFGVDSIINFNIIPCLIDKLVDEKEPKILVLILTLLKILNEGELAPMVI